VSRVAAGSSIALPFVTTGMPSGLAFGPDGYLYVSSAFVFKVAVSATVAPAAGGVLVRPALPGGPILLGDASHPVDGINLSSAELADIQTTGPLTFDGGGGAPLVINDGTSAAATSFTVTDTTVGWGGRSFRYAGLGGLTIQGGTGGNTFTALASAAATPLTLVGGGSGDTLTGSDAGNVWCLGGADAGHLFSAAYPSPVTFSNMGNLTAGSGGDYFYFQDGAGITGALTGGGSDVLDYSPYTTSVVVDLQTGSATGVGGRVSGIAAVIGGSGAPAGAGVYNLLIGSGGDYLQGGTGRRNILVAGGSASYLVAGDGEDLLVGGSTAYDTEAGLASWQQLAAYWAGSDAYATRAANLLSGAGVPPLDATTVTGNGGGNVLVGGGALALLFSDGLDAIAGFDQASQQVAITP
jgi:hypothetical protein